MEVTKSGQYSQSNAAAARKQDAVTRDRIQSLEEVTVTGLNPSALPTQPGQGDYNSGPNGKGGPHPRRFLHFQPVVLFTRETRSSHLAAAYLQIRFFHKVAATATSSRIPRQGSPPLV